MCPNRLFVDSKCPGLTCPSSFFAQQRSQSWPPWGGKLGVWWYSDFQIDVVDITFLILRFLQIAPVTQPTTVRLYIQSERKCPKGGVKTVLPPTSRVRPGSVSHVVSDLLLSPFQTIWTYVSDVQFFPLYAKTVWIMLIRWSETTLLDQIGESYRCESTASIFISYYFLWLTKFQYTFFITSVHKIAVLRILHVHFCIHTLIMFTFIQLYLYSKSQYRE